MLLRLKGLYTTDIKCGLCVTYATLMCLDLVDIVNCAFLFGSKSDQNVPVLGRSTKTSSVW